MKGYPLSWYIWETGACVGFFLAATLSTIGCKETPAGPSGGAWLLYHASFESGGQASFDGWQAFDAGTTGPTFFSDDVPANAGQWSMGLRARDFLIKQTSMVRTFPVSGLVRSGRLRLVYGAKAPYTDTHGRRSPRRPTMGASTRTLLDLFSGPGFEPEIVPDSQGKDMFVGRRIT